MMGGGGGSSDLARRQREAEVERQRRIEEGIQLINTSFRGGKMPVNPVAGNALSYGQTYYDAGGKPVHLQDPGPKTQTLRLYSGSGGQGSYTDQTRTLPSPRASHPSQLFAGVEEKGGFDPDFYSGVEKDYVDYYTPLLNEQYRAAQRQQLLGTPSSQSSAYLRNVGDLGTAYEREMTGVRQKGRTRADQTRGQVEDTRLQLIRAAEQGSAPDVVAQQAATRSQLLAEPQPYEAIGDLFSRFAGQYANRQSARNAGYDVDAPLTFNRGKSKSVSTVY